MDVPVSTLRAELKSWIERANDGEDVIITERGLPVARLVPVASSTLLETLERDGLLDAPATERVSAETQQRPTPRSPNAVSSIMRRLRR